MASAIDDTKPVTGTPTTQSVRDNFAAAKSEITALQAAVPTWTVGSVPFATSTTALGQDNANLFFDNTNDRLGIGTTAPGAKLTVSANAAALQAPSAGVQLQVGGVDAANVGHMVDAYGGIALFNLRRANNTAAAPGAIASGDIIGQLGCFGYGASAYSGGRVLVRGFATEAWSNTAQGAALSFQTTPNTTVATAEAMRIDGSGNVGIGTGSPNGKLSVRVATDTNMHTLSTLANEVRLLAMNDAFNAYKVLSVDASTLNLCGQGGGGVVVGVPTGGSHGAGTLAAVTVYGNNVVLTSDANLKTDIEPLPDCLPLVTGVEPKAFRWKPLEGASPPDFAAKVNRGFLAQDVAKVLGGDAATIDLGGMVAVLWQAVRELSARVAELEGDPAPRH
jgi:hypothetical protein